jgi:hypothetical protein
MLAREPKPIRCLLGESNSCSSATATVIRLPSPSNLSISSVYECRLTMSSRIKMQSLLA